MKAAIEKLLREINDAIGRCKASELETYKALVNEAEGWSMRLEELEREIVDD